jgi:hypothetical protein
MARPIRAHKSQMLKAAPHGTGTKTLDFGRVIQLDDPTEKIRTLQDSLAQRRGYSFAS